MAGEGGVGVGEFEQADGGVSERESEAVDGGISAERGDAEVFQQLVKRARDRRGQLSSRRAGTLSEQARAVRRVTGPR